MRVERTATKNADAQADADGTKLADALGKEHDREIREEIVLARQRDRFDFETEENTELQREYNTIRDMMLAQMKIDDEVVKKYVALI
ncbi:MAG TPA: hypothetical protein VGZ02_05765 [Candidatus Baltobacteraceae bacterium]|jgi:hypothetical protein|nr:hypothetical protein [Candidatus Baltobacteraceae bacterium]